MHHLPGPQGVGSGLKSHDDPREPNEGLRLDLVEKGHSVEQVLLQRDGDQLFHFDRRQTESFGLDLNGDWCELGQGVNGRVLKLPDSEDHQRRSQSHDQESELQA